MELPTEDDIIANPGAALRRIRDLRLALDEVEVAAIGAAVAGGWSLRSAAVALGISRQAVTQRLQRRLHTRRPKAALVRAAEERRGAEAREHRNRLDTMVAEINRERRERAALAQQAERDAAAGRAVGIGVGIAVGIGVGNVVGDAA